MLKRKVRSFMLGGLAMLFFTVLTLSSFAQQITVKGRISAAEDDSSLPGVSVVVKGTTKGTISDFDGNYSLKANTGDVLVFQFLGMESQEHKVKASTLDVALKNSSIGIDEVVAIGYGVQRKKEITGAVASVKSEELQKISTADLGNALQGKVAGVSVQSSSGAPGASANIQIRGIASIDGSNSPLWVVDGIPYDGDPRLSPNEIQTMDVLKDAASCAIYGTRGAAGVILVTTKQGKAGKMRISLTGNYGIQDITSGMDLMNTEEWLYYNMVYQRNNNNKHDAANWTALENQPTGFTNNTNLMDVIQKDGAAVQNYGLNVSGGKKDITYNVSANYFDQDGILINSGFERFNVRANTNVKSGRWNIRASLGFKVEEREYEPWQLLYEAYKYKPYQSALDPNQGTIQNAGSESGNDAINMGNIMAKFKQTDIANTDGFDGKLITKYEIAKGLTWNTQLGGNVTNSTRITTNPLFEVFTDDGLPVVNPQTRSKVKNLSSRSYSMTGETGLNWIKKFGKNKVTLLGVATAQKSHYSQFYAMKYDIFSNEVTPINGATGEYDAASGTGWNQDRVDTSVGLLARAQYDYDGRYLLSASVRRDASSKFGEESRWGNFPSFMVGWNISEEQFWQSMKEVMNTLKLRGSYGTTGNNGFQSYQTDPTISLGRDYVFGLSDSKNLAVGAIQTGYANPYLAWETTVERNMGIDMAFLKNKITFSADFYLSDKQDMLMPLLLPSSVGAGQAQSVTLNIGDMTNKGMELAAGYRHSGKFSWGINATYSKNINKVTRMSENNKFNYFSDGHPVNLSGNKDLVTAVKEGDEAGSFYLIPTNGIIRTQEELEEYLTIEPTAKMGDLRYVDVNEDGQIGEEDRVNSGSGAPEFEVGLNYNASYKGLDFSMQWYGSYGNEIINGSKMYSYIYGTHKDLLSQWSEANPNAPLPAARGGSHMNYRGWSDFWVEDGSFIRLKNVTLGYTMPKSMLKGSGINKVRVYFATDNPLTITKYEGYDPEVGNNGLSTRGLDKGRYPISAQYRFGFELGF